MTAFAPSETLPLCKPVMSESVREHVMAVLESGYLVAGPKVGEFEKQLSGILGEKPVLAVANGTAALHLAMLAVGIGPGDEVIVPAMTYPAPVNVVRLLGATPVLVDVHRETGCLNPDLLEEKITGKTRLIVPVHQFGIPADMHTILGIAAQHGIPVVEDAACALGAFTPQGPCGSLGDMGCFSFHPRKIITTGEGGAVVFRKSQYRAQVEQLRNHGQDMAQVLEERFVRPGFNLRLSDIHGAVGLAQLAQLDDFIRSRAFLAAEYASLLEDCEAVSFLPGHFQEGAVVQSMVVLLQEGLERETVMTRMRAIGIEVTVASYGIHNLPWMRTVVDARDYPVAEAWDRRGMTLPLFPGMEPADVKRVTERLKMALGGQVG